MLPSPTNYALCTIKTLLLLLLAGTAARAQEQFVLTPTAPSDAPTTWADIFTSTTELHIKLPPGITVPGMLADSTETKTFVVARRLKVTARDAEGVPTLQVIYLKATDVSGLGLPGGGANAMDAGAATQGKTFEVNCKTGDVSVVSGGASGPTSTPASAEEALLVKRECRNSQRLGELRGVIGGLKVGQSKTSLAASLFGEEIEQFGIKQWDISLRELSAGPPVTATFSIKGRPDPTSQTGKSFPSFEGTLVVDEAGRLLDLTLKSSSNERVERLPDGKSQIVSKADLTINFRQQILP